MRLEFFSTANLCSAPIQFMEEKALSYMTDQHKRMGLIALAVIHWFAMCYLLYKNRESITEGIFYLKERILKKEDHNSEIVFDKYMSDEAEERENGSKVDDVSALMEDATELFEQGSLEEAKEKFLKLLNINSRDVFALRGYAEVLRLQGKLAEARAKFEELLKIDSQNVFALGGLASILSELGELKEAQEKYEKALELAPKNAFLLRGYATNLHLQGQLKEAERNFVKALEYEPRDFYALSRYSEVLRKMGNFEKADAKFEEAMKLLS